MLATTFNRLNELKSSLSTEQKKKLILGLQKLKSSMSENDTTLSPQEPMYLSEEYPNKERSVVSKTFPVDGDFDPYVNQNRGIQFAPKEADAIRNFRKVSTPTMQTPFMVKFESTDDFGNNTTTVIKKYKQGNQFVFTAFTKHDNSNIEAEPKPEANPQSNPVQPKTPNLQGQHPKLQNVSGKMNPMSAKPSQPSQPPLKEADENAISKKIIVTKTITFSDEINGSNILSDFLRKLDL